MPSLPTFALALPLSIIIPAPESTTPALLHSSLWLLVARAKMRQGLLLLEMQQSSPTLRSLKMVSSNEAEIRPASACEPDKIEADCDIQPLSPPGSLKYGFFDAHKEPEETGRFLAVQEPIVEEKCCCFFSCPLPNNRDTERRSSAQVRNPIKGTSQSSRFKMH